MQLGTLLAQLRDETDAARAIEALGDVVLFAEVAAMGDAFDETPGEYLAAATGRFAARGTDEDWLGLRSALEASPDPARALLTFVVRWALRRDAVDP